MLKPKHWKDQANKDREFLQHLYDYFYGELSELIHGELNALVYAAWSRFAQKSKDELDDKATEVYMDHTFLFLCIMTEINNHLDRGLDDELKKAWMEIYGYCDDFIEIIKMRYGKFIDWDNAKLWSE